MCGQEGFYGTSAFQVILDLEQMKKLQAIKISYADENAELDNILSQMEDTEDNPCSTQKMVIKNDVANIKEVELGDDNNYNPGF